MAGILKQIWSLLRYRRSKLPESFSLGQRQAPSESSTPASAENKILADLEQNEARLRAIFVSPPNADLVIRSFELAGNPKTKAFLANLEGMTERQTINLSILTPLLRPEPVGRETGAIHDLAYVERAILPGNQTKRLQFYAEAVQEIASGNTVLFLTGAGEALSIETKGFEHRVIGRTLTEQVVRGPQEGLVETLRSNTAAIRRHLRAPSLVTELFTVGARSRADVALMYLHDVANPRLVREVKRRIKAIGDKVDFLSDSGTLEQLLEDQPHALVPQMLSTERPDRCAAFLSEGHLVLLVGTSPYALIVPMVFTAFIHAAEDYYLRWPYATFVRLIRFLAAFIALLLPALYIAVVNYHQEMIPTDLLLAIAASRENVPFPAIVEVLIMEASFELIREAGVRIPSVIGPTIGIVGALILGQAAVAASIVSPILVIIVALTALSSFAVPNYSAAFSLRVLRFIFILLAAMMGFYGIAFGLMALSIHLVSLKSFGVPFMSPISPYRPTSRDRIDRPAIYKQPQRPFFLRPLDLIRQRGPVRTWSPSNEAEEEDGDG